MFVLFSRLLKVFQLDKMDGLVCSGHNVYCAFVLFQQGLCIISNISVWTMIRILLMLFELILCKHAHQEYLIVKLKRGNQEV